MKLLEIYDEFILDKQIEGLSQVTIKNYDYFVKKSFIDEGMGNVQVYELKIMAVKLYIREMQEKGLSTVTVQTFVRHMRAFLNYLYNKRYSDINWNMEIKLPKAFKATVEILMDDEIMMIFAQYKNAKTEYQIRDRAILALLLDTGIRASELCGIKMDDINLNQGFIKIRGKGAKERFVKISLITKKYIYEYLHKRPSVESGELFVGKMMMPLKYMGLKTMIYRLADTSGIERLHLHLLRHTYATRKILVDNMDLFSLQISLGHTDLSMVRRYSHVATEYTVLGVKMRSLTYILA